MIGCLASKGSELRFVLPSTRRSPFSKKGASRADDLSLTKACVVSCL